MLQRLLGLLPVSYTHLDVYKRQDAHTHRCLSILFYKITISHCLYNIGIYFLPYRDLFILNAYNHRCLVVLIKINNQLYVCACVCMGARAQMVMF